MLLTAPRRPSETLSGHIIPCQDLTPTALMVHDYQRPRDGGHLVAVNHERPRLWSQKLRNAGREIFPAEWVNRFLGGANVSGWDPHAQRWSWLPSPRHFFPEEEMLGPREPRAASPPGSPAARTPPPRTSPTRTCTTRGWCFPLRDSRLISLLPPLLPPSAAPTWAVSTGCRSRRRTFRGLRRREQCAHLPVDLYVGPSVHRMDVSTEAFLSRFGVNDIHAVPGDITRDRRRSADSRRSTWRGSTLAEGGDQQGTKFGLARKVARH